MSDRVENAWQQFKRINQEKVDAIKQIDAHDLVQALEIIKLNIKIKNDFPVTHRIVCEALDGWYEKVGRA